jgi:glycosyltransferase involved in cell wall biosynthesis
VLDEASTDRTEVIANEQADRVLKRAYQNSASQKNWAIPQMAHEWVLVVDADERVTPELEREIQGVLDNNGPHDGYRISRLNHFMGKPIRGCGWQRDDVLRLFRRDRGRYQERHVHADVVFEDGKPATVGQLRGRLLHYTYEDFEHYLRKYFRYVGWAGEDRLQKTPRVGWRHLLVRPVWRFFRQFILFRGYRDGKIGFLICAMAAYSVLLKYGYAMSKQLERRASGDPKKPSGES